MEEIYYEPDEVWELLESMEDGCTEIIAENEEYGVTIYLDEGFGNPMIIVNVDSAYEVYEEITDPDQCMNLTKEMYETYLYSGFITNSVLESLDDEVVLDDADFEDLIEEREQELDESIDQLICDILGDNADTYAGRQDADRIVIDLKEAVLRYLFDHYGLEPYRPMILVDEEGNEEFEKFPYSKLYS